MHVSNDDSPSTVRRALRQPACLPDSPESYRRFGRTIGVSPELPYMPLISSAHSSQRSESLPS